MRQATGATARGDDPAAAFEAASAGLRSALAEISAMRPELEFEDIPAPRTLAPFSTALGAVIRAGEEEVAAGRLVVLYDPAGQQGWDGTVRVVAYLRADLEPEIASDPLLGQVAWSWLTEALDGRTAGYTAASGTVTRVVTEGFGAKAGETPESGVEVRASWTPAGGPGRGDGAGPAGLGLSDHLAAWCGALCAASGLPPLTAGVSPIRPPAPRRDR